MTRWYMENMETIDISISVGPASVYAVNYVFDNPSLPLLTGKTGGN